MTNVENAQNIVFRVQKKRGRMLATFNRTSNFFSATDKTKIISVPTLSQAHSTLRIKKLYKRGLSVITGQEVDYTRWGLKMALMQQGVKQSHIAKAMGKDQAWVSKVVNGWIDPSDEDTARMASVLNVGVDELRVLFSSAA